MVLGCKHWVLRLRLVIFSSVYLKWLWASCWIVQSHGTWWRLEEIQVFCAEGALMLVLFPAPIPSGNLFPLLTWSVYSQKEWRFVKGTSLTWRWSSLSETVVTLCCVPLSRLNWCLLLWGALCSQKSCAYRLLEHKGFCTVSLLSGKVLNCHFLGGVFTVIVQERMMWSHCLGWWLFSRKSADLWS